MVIPLLIISAMLAAACVADYYCKQKPTEEEIWEIIMQVYEERKNQIEGEANDQRRDNQGT